MLYSKSMYRQKPIRQKEVEMNESKQQRIRVCLKAYDHKLIDLSASKIVDVVKRTDARVAGPVPLPTKRRLYCVLRSPHVDKKSREHFEMRIHKRIIDIYDPTAQTTEELTRIEQLLQTANKGQMLGLSLAMTIVPILLLLASHIIIKKKYIIDEKLYDQMVAEIQARKETNA